MLSDHAFLGVTAFNDFFFHQQVLHLHSYNCSGYPTKLEKYILKKMGIFCPVNLPTCYQPETGCLNIYRILKFFLYS